MTDPCENCVNYCERHALFKSRAEIRLCQNDETTRAEYDRTAEARRNELVGEKMAATLKGLGVTREAYAAFKLKFGMEPTCNCGRRQRWLNKVHAAANTLFRSKRR